MIRCIFTLDYEIYGDGTGSLKELVYEPTACLTRLFQRFGARFVNFVEVAELERIEEAGSDQAIGLVKEQVRELYRCGHEIALHLHPQWYNARFEGHRWLLDYSEYNLCTLAPCRISELVDRSVSYLAGLVGNGGFKPLAFRAGNWLFQPTQNAAMELSRRGVLLDSSVFKGGLQHNHSLDYRPAMKNGYYWQFSADVNVPDPTGAWVELPIHTEMVAPWRMGTSKRIAIGNSFRGARGVVRKKAGRALDFLRLRYPRKFDFCRMTFDELASMMNRLLALDEKEPETLKPVVAIGHSKDLGDFETIEAFLAFLSEKKVQVATFDTVYNELLREGRAN